MSALNRDGVFVGRGGENSKSRGREESIASAVHRVSGEQPEKRADSACVARRGRL